MNGMRLTAQVQQQLEQTLRHTHDARLFRRTLAILEYSRGRPIKEVAQSLGVTRQSIHNWVVKLQQQGSSQALVDGPRPGRPRQADARVETLLQTLMMVPPYWHQVATCSLMYHVTGCRASSPSWWPSTSGACPALMIMSSACTLAA